MRMPVACFDQARVVMPGLSCVELAARTRRIYLLVFALWLMNIVDLLLTISAHELGVLCEQNPIAHAIIPHGMFALTTFKILLVGFGSFILLFYSTRRVVECLCWLVVMVYLGVSVQWLICYEWYEEGVAFRLYAGTPAF